jgi:hypothetical protein
MPKQDGSAEAERTGQQRGIKVELAGCQRS